MREHHPHQRKAETMRSTIWAAWRAHRAERAAQRAYLHALAQTDVSPLDMRDWTPDRLDRLANELWPELTNGDDDARL
jgi:hypothetical protein